MPDAEAKERDLITMLRAMPRALVAFSAGVDSTYLLAVAHAELGERVTAVTADSPSLARTSLAEARAFCVAHGIAHHVVATDEFEHDAYLANDGNRCYHCKAALLKSMHGLLAATATSRDGAALFIGAIADDLGDHRPGMRAAAEAGAQFPLAQCGFTKADVRERSRVLGLASWNRPAEPCLSSRIPYGERVTVGGLRMIEQAEAVLKAHGFPICRARHHQRDDGGYHCRIEVPREDIPRAEAMLSRLESDILAVGYRSIAVDPNGFVSGGFNAMLSRT